MCAEEAKTCKLTGGKNIEFIKDIFVLKILLIMK
jgi:hypothetical protein